MAQILATSYHPLTHFRQSVILQLFVIVVAVVIVVVFRWSLSLASPSALLVYGEKMPLIRNAVGSCWQAASLFTYLGSK